MNESNNLPEKVNNLPAVVPEPSLATATAGKSAVAGILTALAPLALEVAYGLTPRWLSAISAGSGTSNRSTNTSSRSRTGAGLRRRRRGLA